MSDDLSNRELASWRWRSLAPSGNPCSSNLATRPEHDERMRSKANLDPCGRPVNDGGARRDPTGDRRVATAQKDTNPDRRFDASRLGHQEAGDVSRRSPGAQDCERSRPRRRIDPRGDAARWCRDPGARTRRPTVGTGHRPRVLGRGVQRRAACDPTERKGRRGPQADGVHGEAFDRSLPDPLRGGRGATSMLQVPSRDRGTTTPHRDSSAPVAVSFHR